VVVADLNRDGRPDLVVIEPGGQRLVWWENTGTGWLRREIDDDSPKAGVVVADIDRNGSLDLVISQPGQNRIRWLSNINGDGLTWSASLVSGSAAGATGLAVADIDRDGRPDVVAAVTGVDELRFWRQTAAGVWQERLIDSGIVGIREIKVGDVDGDGRIDVVGLVPGSGQIRWWINPPDPGTASSWAIRFVGNAPDPAGLALIDFNRDGALDVLAGSRGQGFVGLWLNDGSGQGGSWQRNNLGAVAGPRAILGLDLDKDGDIDVLVAADAPGANLGWFENRAGEGFAWRDIPQGPAASSLATGDLDGDGDVDIVAASADSSLVVLDNRMPRRSARFDPLRWGYLGFPVPPLPADTANKQPLIGDVDGNGRADAVQLINRASGQLSPPSVVVARPNGAEGFFAGQFESFTVAGTGSPPDPALLRTAVVADFNRDGRPDLMIGLGARDGGTDTLAWCQRSSGPSWICAARYIEVPGSPGASNTAIERRMFAADVNRDGRIDLVAQARDWLLVGGGNRRLVWLENLGDMGASVAFRQHLIAGGDLEPVAVADITGNGRPDVVAVNDIFRNDADDGSIWTRFANPIPAGSQIHAVGDIDGDGRLDLLAEVPGSGLSWAWRSGASWTVVPMGVAPGCPPSVRCMLIDLDGDGDLDVVGARQANVASLFWIENRIADALPPQPAWVAHALAPGMAFGVMEAAYGLDIVDNGLPDVALRLVAGEHYLPNVGGSLLADWRVEAPGAVVEGAESTLLAARIRHGGRSGDQPIALTGLQLSLAQGPLPNAALLDASGLGARIASVRIYRDDGDGLPGTGDVLLGSVSGPGFGSEGVFINLGAPRAATTWTCCDEGSDLFVALVPTVGAAGVAPNPVYLRGGHLQAAEAIDGLQVATQPPPTTLNPGQVTFAAPLELVPPPPPGQSWLSVRVEGEGRVQSLPGNIDCDAGGGVACRDLLETGAQVTLGAQAQAGYSFAGWAGDCSGLGDCNLNLTGNLHASARFVHAGPQGSVNITLLGNGTITSDPPRLNCPSTCSADFDLGSQITLIATPNPGAEFDRWYPAFCTEPTEPTCRFTVQPTLSVTVGFIQAASPFQTLTVSRSGQGRVLSDIPGIDCGNQCQAQLATNQRVVLSAQPDPGWRLARWTGRCEGAAETCILLMDLDQVTAAEFEPVPVLHRLSVALEGSGRVFSIPVGIDCAPTCSIEFEQGTQLSLTAQAAPGFSFAGWVGADCPGLGPCAFPLDTATDISAVFVSNTPRVPLQVSVDRGGRVTSVPAGIDCIGPATCSAEFDSGSLVQLAVQSTQGFSFVSWDGDCSGSGACQLTMDAVREVEALFVSDDPLFRLDVARSGLGFVASTPAGISCGQACSADFIAGSPVSLSAAPASGWRFGQWSGDCSGGDVCDLLMNANHQVSASFIRQRLLTVEVLGMGRVTGSPSGIDCPGSCQAAFDEGSTVNLNASADAGWRFDGWIGDAAGCGVATACALVISQAAQVQARFLLDADRIFDDGFEP